ncbi:MAG: autotransporter-associated beta strand repeat-containing protein [Kiritimatiellia bacterium]
MNLNGGLLRANSTTASFWNNNASVTATVGASGATVDTQGYEITVSQVLGGAGALAKSGTGTLTLSGANTYSGPLAVNAGHLQVTGSLGALSSLTTAASTQFSYAPGTPATLNLAASAPMSLGNNSTVGLSWNTTTSSRIATTGAATVGSGIGFEMVGTPNTGTEYTLLTAASGLNSTYVVRNNYNYVVSSWNIDPSGTFVKMTPTAVAAITTAYWTGGLSGAANVWAASDGSSASNWASTNGAAVQVLVPGSGADVIVSNSALTTAPTSTTLGANMSVKSVTISDTVNGLGLNADGYTLTVGTGGISMSASVPSSTIGAKVALGANQTWTNNSGSPLTVSGVVSGTSTLAKSGTGTIQVTGDNTFTGALTVSAGTFEVGGAGRLNLGSYSGAITDNGTLSINTSANQTLSGVISGTGALVKGGAGTLTLPIQNTYSGGTTVNGGILDLTGGGGTGGTIRGTVTVNAGGTLRLSANDVTGYNTDSTRLGVINLVGGTLNVNTPSANQTLGNAVINLTGGAITGAAGSNLDFFQGSSTINSLASGTTSTISGTKLAIRQTGGLTINVADGAAATDLAISSQIYNNGFAAEPLTKTGLGTLLLSGNNINTGTTTISNGLLIASGGSALSDSSVVSIANLSTAALQVNNTEEVGLLSGGGASGGTSAWRTASP